MVVVRDKVREREDLVPSHPARSARVESQASLGGRGAGGGGADASTGLVQFLSPGSRDAHDGRCSVGTRGGREAPVSIDPSNRNFFVLRKKKKAEGGEGRLQRPCVHVKKQSKRVHRLRRPSAPPPPRRRQRRRTRPDRCGFERARRSPWGGPHRSWCWSRLLGRVRSEGRAGRSGMMVQKRLTERGVKDDGRAWRQRRYPGQAHL